MVEEGWREVAGYIGDWGSRVLAATTVSAG
jgi:hypothetical protein